MPEVLAILARTVGEKTLVWRTTFSELARWWRWRAERRWLVIPRENQCLEVQLDEWDNGFPLALEIQRGRFRCTLPVTGPRLSLRLAGLAYERIEEPGSLPDPPEIDRRALSLKRAVQTALDWETVTPRAELPRSTLSNRVKRGLRWWKLQRMGIGS